MLDAGPEPMYEEKMRVPPWGPGPLSPLWFRTCPVQIVNMFEVD